jgi:hypothetical protein
MQIITQKQEVVNLNEIKIIAVRDLFEEKKIIARIQGLNRPIYLWNGETEYASAGVWTNESALQRAAEVLALPEVPWAF